MTIWFSFANEYLLDFQLMDVKQDYEQQMGYMVRFLLLKLHNNNNNNNNNIINKQSDMRSDTSFI